MGLLEGHLVNCLPKAQYPEVTTAPHNMEGLQESLCLGPGLTSAHVTHPWQSIAPLFNRDVKYCRFWSDSLSAVQKSNSEVMLSS